MTEDHTTPTPDEADDAPDSSTAADGDATWLTRDERETNTFPAGSLDDWKVASEAPMSELASPLSSLTNGDADAGDSDPSSGMDSGPGALLADRVETLPFDRETSTPRIASELRRIESEIRELIEERDSRRKRKFSGTRRWHELEEDILTWKFTDRFTPEQLNHVQQLVARRHHLFHRLRFLASTRPTWNS